jgi:hypothetical protein
MRALPPSTPLDAVMNAAIRYRAIVHNREVDSTPEQQRDWDERVGLAEVALEKALLEAGAMGEEDGIESISTENRDVTVLFDDMSMYIIHT